MTATNHRSAGHWLILQAVRLSLFFKVNFELISNVVKDYIFNKYKLLCPRGTQTCALAVANIKVNGNGKVILDTHPESDQHQN